VQEIRLLYQPPQAIVEPEDAMRWIAKWTEAVLAECRNPALLHRGWVEFRRLYTKPFWPTPGMFCEVIRTLRNDEMRYAPKADNGRLPPPDYHKPELVSEDTRNRTLAALAEADFMARSGNRVEAMLGDSLVRLGLSIIERNGAPRSEARNLL